MRRVLLAIVTIGLFSGEIRAETKERVAVLDFVGVGVPQETVATTTKLVSAEIGRTGRYDTVGRDDVAALLGLERFKQTLGCDHAGCRGELESVGRMLQARFVVSGSIGKVGSVFVLNAQLMDVTKMQVLARASRRVDSLEQLAADAGGIARELLAEPATLHLSGQVPGPAVFVDDTQVATLPVGALPLQLTGKRRLRVESADHLPFSTDVVLEAGRATRVRLDLERIDGLEAASKSRKTWGIALVVAGLASGGGAVLTGRAGAAAHDDYEAMDPLLVTQPQLDDAASRVRGWYGGTWALGALFLAGVGTGTWLLLTDPAGDRLRAHQGLALLVAPSGVAVASRF